MSELYATNIHDVSTAGPDTIDNRPSRASSGFWSGCKGTTVGQLWGTTDCEDGPDGFTTSPETSASIDGRSSRDWTEWSWWDGKPFRSCRPGTEDGAMRRQREYWRGVLHGACALAAFEIGYLAYEAYMTLAHVVEFLSVVHQ